MNRLPRPRFSALAALASVVLAVAGLAPARGQISGPWVSPGLDGLQYRVRTDTNLGDRIPDFSSVGFGAGLVAIPTVPAVVTVSPVAGDNTARIQAAIDQVAALPLRPDGFRGAVQLAAGTFDIAGQLRITADGVVLRGAGRDANTAANTVLIAQGTSTRSLIQIQGAAKRAVGSTYQVADTRVPVGATSFSLADTTGLAVGHTVTVTRPHSAQWVTDVAMDTYWAGQTRSTSWDRVITRIEGNTVSFDAPITTALEARYGGATLRRYEPGDRVTHVGVENIRGQSLAIRDESNEARAWSFVQVNNAEHVFVRDIQATYFPYAAVSAEGGAKWLTVDNARNDLPSGLVTGGRRYAYNVSEGGELVLVQNSSASDGRHDFVTGSDVAGPIVFYNSTATAANAEAGPHQRWATGILFDNIRVSGDQLNIHNRGSYGTGHGWAGGNSVIWNSAADGFAVQNPPTAQNWLIGSTGTRITGGGFVFPGEASLVESHGQRVPLGDAVNNPLDSLYVAQLRERQATGAELRFWVGDQGTGWSAASQAGWTNWSSTRGIRTNAAAPGPRDDVVFAVSGTAPVVTSPGGPLAVGSLQFDATPARVTVNLDGGSSPLTLGSRGITVFSGTHVIVGTAGASADLVADASQTWEIRGTSALTVNARLGPATTGSRTITKAGAGTLTLAANSAGTGAFKAGWLIGAGTLRLGHASGLGWSQNAVTVAAGATLELDGVGLGQNNGVVSLAGTGTGGAGALRSLSGDVSLAAGTGRLHLATGTVGIAVVSGTLTIHQVTEGPGRLTKTGAGTLVLTSANTFTGTTSVNQGTLRVTHGGALQSSPIVLQTGGMLALPTDSRLVLSATSLTIDQATGGKLDIGRGRIDIAAGATEVALRADVIAGRASGSFSGTSGIMTTGGTAGAATTAVVGYRVFASGSAIVAWAANGDANLDGQVNFTDISLVNNGGKFGQGSSTGATWAQGDFNYSGGVTFTDINLLNNSGLYGAGSYLPVSSLGSLGSADDLVPGAPDGRPLVLATVPEPGAGLLAAAGLGLLGLVRRGRPPGRATKPSPR